jgi:hypothetical protein
MRSLKLLALVLLAVGFSISATAAVAKPIRLATQDAEDPLQVRPSLVSYTGDGTGYLAGRTSSPRRQGSGGLRWLNWGRKRAVAHGYNWLNHCRPSCADGNFSRHRAIVTARRPRHGLFTRLVIKFRFQSRWRYDHRILENFSGFWVWGICGNRYTKPC